MAENTVAFRLKLFIEYKGLTDSRVAVLCDIPRPSLSQLLTGRNKKISDIIVGQIHSRFPDLNVLWLLFDEGQMLVNDSPVKADFDEDIIGQNGSDPSTTINLSSGLFSSQFDHNSLNMDVQKANSVSGKSGISKNAEEIPLSMAKNDPKSIENQLIEANFKIRNLTRDIENLVNNPRKVTQIMVYYDDSTFETFIPKSQT